MKTYNKKLKKSDFAKESTLGNLLNHFPVLVLFQYPVIIKKDKNLVGF